MIRALEDECYINFNRDYHLYRELGKYRWTIRVYISPSGTNQAHIEYFLPEEINTVDWMAFYEKAVTIALAEEAKLVKMKELKARLLEKHADALDARAEKRRRIAEGQELLKCLV